jgi:ABC-type multidrug transport system fused ATPase/permease subunit
LQDFYFTYIDIPISDLSLILAYSFTLVGSVQWIVRLTVDVTMQVEWNGCLFF